MSISGRVGASAELDGGGLADHLAALSATRDRESLCSAACLAAGELLGLDGAWMACRRRGRVGAEAEWLRPAARAQRLGGARLEELLLEVSQAGGPVVGTVGRQATVAIPVRVAGHLQAALVGAVRGGAAIDAQAIGLARLLGVHVSACLEMVMATTAARELAMLEMSSPAVPDEAPLPPAPAAGPRFDVLRSLSAMLTGARSETAIAHAVVGELRRLIEYDSCRFYLRAPAGDLLVPLAQSGLAPVYSGDSAEALIVAVGEGITGRAFAEGRPLRIDDAAAVDHGVEIPGTEPMDESMLVAPMVAEGGPIGVLVTARAGLGAFSDEDLDVLQIVAAQAAVACEGLRLAAEHREARSVAEALLELGAALSLQSSVEAIAQMLALAIDRLLDSAGISLWLRDRDELVPAMAVGYTPQEQERLMAARLPVVSEPFAAALETRRITTVSVDDAPLLAGCLDAAPGGTSFAMVAVGERAANRAVIVVQRGPRRGALTYRDEEMLMGVADQALLAMTNRSLYDELETSFLATVEALGNALDLMDQYTNDHAQALVGLCTEVAERMNRSPEEIRDIRFAAPLHDVGKIGIPREILNKPGRLTEAEFAVMKQHPSLGAQIIAPVAALAGARELVLTCHEHWDGSGYPRRLRGEAIPVGARILLACDAFHAMTSDRVYRQAMTVPEAVAELRRCSGTQFHPQVVDALVAVIAASGAESAR